MVRKIFLVLAGIVLTGVHPTAAPGQREALVIGNSQYEGNAALENPGNDADAMAAVLKELGFAVTTKKDVNLSQMEDALVAFRRTLNRGGLGLFFYAGHGVQVRGENYLVPIGARMREEFEVKRQCVEVSQVLDVLTESECNLKVVILDCCRDNPLQRAWRRSGATKGLAVVSSVPEGTMIAFSTSPNQTAADGRGRNSPYTQQLVAALRSRPAEGLELSEAFREASRAVKRETGQVPWLNLEASLEKYYLWSRTGSPTQSTGLAASTAPTAAISPSEALMRLPLKVTPNAPPMQTVPSGRPREITNSIGLRLALIPAGEFMMGSAESAEAAAAYLNQAYGTQYHPDDFQKEHPQHPVRITKPFYLGQYEVTVGQFRRFIDDAKAITDAERNERFEGAYGLADETGVWEVKADASWRNAGFPQGDEHPVVNVSWNDAAAFCEWLTRKEGKRYRLPTEAEWEYACRAGTTTRYCSGDDAETLAQVGNVADPATRAKFRDWTTINANDGRLFTAPVGFYRPNTFGLYDMHGNVWEWCADWYEADYFAVSPRDDPSGPMKGSERVVRGGGWADCPRNCRSANRDSCPPDYRCLHLGFRVVQFPADNKSLSSNRPGR